MAKVPAKEDEQKTGTALMQVDFGDDAGAGMENIGADEYRIPIFRIVQSNSQAVKPVTAGGIAGAKSGMIMNTGTGELYDGDKGGVLIPCAREHYYLERIPFDAGGGFIGIRPVGDPLVEQLLKEQGRFGTLKTSDGNEIVETFSLYSIFIPDGLGPIRCAVPFQSTQIKKYQQFIGRSMGIEYRDLAGKPTRPPLWAHKWNLTTRFESNKSGDYFGWIVGLNGKRADGSEDHPIKSLMKRNDELYLAGKAFHELVTSGRAQADFDKDAKAASGDDKEVPF